jgi:hypothetical protein
VVMSANMATRLFLLGRLSDLATVGWRSIEQTSWISKCGKVSEYGHTAMLGRLSDLAMVGLSF